ncbi:hypothetical protein [Amycolatopsis nigrescens]|uniref:hypothetical protein n=1 Tax=Amycolatopsis nigrescens TaxID=381445 RepID=UPI0003677708|nr:hypothetical protein [Amycolatopsis nigrescens]
MKHVHTLPEITRPDAGLVLSSEWTVPAGRQTDAMDAAMTAWEHTPWPDGLLSYTVYAGTDGTTLLHYSQWTGEDAVDKFSAVDPPERVRGILDAVPGIERHGVTRYRLHRSGGRHDPAEPPGAIVVVGFETEDRAAATGLVDQLVDGRLDEAPDTPATTDLGVHFHVALDGHRILNYTQWPDEQAHQQVVDNLLQDNGAVMGLINSSAGVRPLGFKRYLRWRGVTG